ncbi:MAG: AAA family ATPase [Coleofasciculaceae cyanobacterium]
MIVQTEQLGQQTTAQKPYLWGIEGFPEQLKGFFQEPSPLGTPAPGNYIIIETPDTPESWIRGKACGLLQHGITDIEVLRICEPLKKFVSDVKGVHQFVGLAMGVDETSLGLPSYWGARPYIDWENSFDDSLPLSEALKFAELVIAKVEPKERQLASIILDGLRRRADVSEYNWDKKYLAEIRARLEKILELNPVDPTERKRLELKALARERDPFKYTDKLIEFCRRTGWSRRDVEQQIRLFKNNTVTPKTKHFSLKDFLALETESISWVFPGLIPSRGVSVIGGHAGAGKTTLAYDAVGALLNNEEFLGEKPVKTGKVLIVSGDELPCFTQDKLIDRGIVDTEGSGILLNWDVSQWEILEEKIADLRPSLVIIDSFSSIHRDPNFDENSSQAKSTIYDLESLSNSYEFGCILIHHLSKSKDNKGVTKLRGSSAISAAASVVCLMEEVSDGNRRLSFPKVRGAQTESLVVRLNEQTGRYEVLSGGDTQTDKSLCDRILAFLQKAPDKRFEQQEILEALGLSSSQKDSVYTSLARLFRRGMITKRPSKLGGRRKVYGVKSDTHLPSPDKVLVQNSVTPIETELELSNTLPNTLPSTDLALEQNDCAAISSNLDTVSDSVKLTNEGGNIESVSSETEVTETEVTETEVTETEEIIEALAEIKEEDELILLVDRYGFDLIDTCSAFVELIAQKLRIQRWLHG